MGSRTDGAIRGGLGAGSRDGRTPERCLNAIGFVLWSGARRLARSPGFAAAVVLTLAIGIGTNTAIFSAVQSVVLRPLPFPDAERLMFVSRAYPGFPQGGGNFSYPAVDDITRGNRSFDTFAAYQAYGALALDGGQEPVRVNVNWVAPSYLRLLGLRPAIGRSLLEQEDRYVDADPVLVLSHDFWRRQFGSARDVVGRRVLLNQREFTIVGVAPAEFRDAPAEQELSEQIDAWIPLGLAHKLLGQFGPTDRAGAILWGIGHRRPGVSVGQARADVAGIGERLARIYPETDRGFGLVARPLKDQLVGELYAPVLLLAAGAAFILLIGCANASNLLLARLHRRQREFAIRAAHGATRQRLVVEIVAENFLLAFAAGGFGLLLATWGVAALHRWVQGGLSPVVRFGLDGRALSGAFLFTIVAGLLFGLLPAALASRVRLRESLSQGGRQGGPASRRSLARALVAGEVALALVLLSGAGLLVKSLHNLTATDLGFRTGNLLTLRLDLRSERYSEGPARARFARQLVEELDHAPGVASVTLWGPSMLGRATWVIEATREGAAEEDPKNLIMSWRHSVNPGALANLGIPLRRGRDFRWEDDERAPLVAIVSESTARAHWPGEDPIGKRFRALRLPGWATVVGVAADARHRQRIDLTDAAMGIPPSGLGPQRDVYFPYAQRPNPAIVVAVRTGGANPAMAVQALRAAVRKMDPTLPVYDVALLEERLARQERGSRVLTILAGAYACIALLLAAIGLFGVLAHSVQRRTQEIGIRRALGASARSVLLLVMEEGLKPTAAGITAGLAAAFLLTRAITSLLYGLTATDPAVFGGITLLLLLVAAAASWIPARRAARVDPMVAMRAE